MKKLLAVVLFTILALSLFAQIKNPDKPLKGKWDFQIEKIWEAENAGEDVFGEVQSIATAKDGRIYIVDSKNFKIFILNKDGKFISSFGNKGAGPGEIMNYDGSKQIFIVNDTIIFSEVSRIQYFSLDGKYKKTVNIPANLKPRAFISEDAFVSAPLTVKDPNIKSAKIKLYNVKDKSEKVIVDFNLFRKSTKVKTIGRRRITVELAIPTVIPLMLVNLRKDKLYYGMSDSYNINIFDLNRKENINFSIEDREQENVSEKLKKDLEKILSPLPPEMAKDIIKNLPQKASFFQDITIDQNGLIYAYVSDTENTNIQAIDIFSPGGKYLYSSVIKLEKGVIIGGLLLGAVLHFAGDLLYISTEDEEGTVKVTKYSVKLPPL